MVIAGRDLPFFAAPAAGAPVHACMARVKLEPCAGGAARGMRALHLDRRDPGAVDREHVVGRSELTGIDDIYISRRHCVLRTMPTYPWVLRVRSNEPYTCYISHNRGDTWIETRPHVWYALRYGTRLALDNALEWCYTVEYEKCAPAPRAAPSVRRGCGAIIMRKSDKTWSAAARDALRAARPAHAHLLWAWVRAFLPPTDEQVALEALLAGSGEERDTAYWGRQLLGPDADPAAPPLPPELRTIGQRRRPTPWLPWHPTVRAPMRHTLVDWMLAVSTQVEGGGGAVFHRSVALLDAYMATESGRKHIDRGRLQLLGTTCLWVASKYECRVPYRLATLHYMCDNQYTKNELRAMERRVLRSLRYRVGGATLRTWLEHLCPPEALESPMGAALADQAALDIGLLDVPWRAVARRLAGPIRRGAPDRAARERLHRYALSAPTEAFIWQRHPLLRALAVSDLQRGPPSSSPGPAPPP